MNNISLTASMRSNLLSLQNISGQVSSTQNKLATGNKVNSAIDNPSSYYTARALNNRADDLNALLDSMGQAVSTIKAATTALEAGADFLEQAAAVATQALEMNAIPDKSYFEEKVGANGAVVTTAQELKDAIAAGKETIVIYGKIDYFENEGISLKAGQKLVGTEYYTGYTGKERFSTLNMSKPIGMSDDSMLSDLTIRSQGSQGIAISSIGTAINNIDLISNDTSVTNLMGILIHHGGTVNFSGKINVNYKAPNASGIQIFVGGVITSNADIVTTSLDFGGTNNGRLHILSGHVKTNKLYSNGGILTVAETAELSVNDMAIFHTSQIDIAGKLNIYADPATNNRLIYLSADPAIGRSNLIIRATAEITGYGAKNLFYIRPKDVSHLLIEAGSCFNLNLDGQDWYLEATKDSSWVGERFITGTDLLSDGSFTVNNGAAKIDWASWQAVSEWELVEAAESQKLFAQYNGVLSQYDALINDASYKGINLLQQDKLSVKFNETGSALLNIRGKDMSGTALGLNVADWQTQGDIDQSLKEISTALKSIRSFSAELGNNYNIITSRQDLTENLINILTEGADKLTLADMNEESANMLALQTRQQLATNSLSLASQASQAVLKLF